MRKVVERVTCDICGKEELSGNIPDWKILVFQQSSKNIIKDFARILPHYISGSEIIDFCPDCWRRFMYLITLLCRQKGDLNPTDFDNMCGSCKRYLGRHYTVGHGPCDEFKTDVISSTPCCCNYEKEL